MKIFRNGIEYELTFSEIHAAHWEHEKRTLIEDIKSRMEEMEIDPNSIDMNTTAHRAQHAIDNDDCLWDAYWRDIEYAIEQEIDANNKEA